MLSNVASHTAAVRHRSRCGSPHCNRNRQEFHYLAIVARRSTCITMGKIVTLAEVLAAHCHCQFDKSGEQDGHCVLLTLTTNILRDFPIFKVYTQRRFFCKLFIGLFLVIGQGAYSVFPRLVTRRLLPIHSHSASAS